MRISDWSSDVCSSDLVEAVFGDRIVRVANLLVDRIEGDRHRCDQGRNLDHRAVTLFRIVVLTGARGYARSNDSDADGRVGAAVVVDVQLVGTQSGFRQGIGEGRIELVARSRSEEHTSELQSLMRISYAVFCLKKKKNIAS